MFIFSKKSDSYVEMIYSLLLQGSRLGESYEGIVNFIEFHLDEPCDKKALAKALKSFKAEIGPFSRYSLPEKECQIKKLKTFKNSDKYRYSEDEVSSIQETKLKDLQKAAARFEDEKIKNYYVVSYGLLSSVEERVTREGIKNYIESKLGDPCDDDLLGEVLSLFCVEKESEGYSSIETKMYRLVGSNERCDKNHAKVLYLNRKIFGRMGMNLEEAKIYQCSSAQEFFQICYSKVMKDVKQDYQRILEIVDEQGIVKKFEEGVKEVLFKYGIVVGEKRVKDYIHSITEEWYFEGNQAVRKVLVGRMTQYLYETMMTKDRSYFDMFNESLSECYKVIQEQAAAITLRALNFEKKGKDQATYSSVTKDACIEFLSNNEYFKAIFEKEIAKDPFNKDMKKLVDSMADSVLGRNLFSDRRRNNVWYLPSMELEPYYADSVCLDYWMDVVDDLRLENSTDSNFVFDQVFEQLEPSEQDMQFLKEKAVEKKEEEQIREQCRSCAFYDRCKLNRRVLNCSGYVPK